MSEPSPPPGGRAPARVTRPGAPALDGDDALPRPLPARQLTGSAAAWLAWLGVRRLLALALTVVAVGLAGHWLLRTPTPPVEAALPVVTSGSAPSGTSPPPSSVGDVAAATTTGDDGAEAAVDPVVVVHVAGAVAAAGVYRLGAPARVVEALAAAGGPAADAELDGLNLAAPLADGQRVYVPSAGEIDPATIGDGLPAAPPTPGTTAGVPAGPVDLNRATATELETLPGVGPAIAAAIVEDRERNGPFATVDDLDRVPGIGPTKLEAIRSLVTV